MPASNRFNGVLLFDKPSGISSHDAVDRVRKVTRQRTVGHAGTLDPLAEGLLVICLGNATKVSRFLTERDKTYQAEICLGMTSETYDAEGVDPGRTPAEVPPLTAEDISSVLDRFQGTISQKVPAYSAVQVSGQRLYKMARKGKTVVTPEREVTIRNITLTEYREPIIRFSVTCGKGTYIRSLAHAVGEQLRCGGYLSYLRRTAVGDFKLEDAVTPDQLVELAQSGTLADRLLPLELALDCGAITVNEKFSRSVVNGQRLQPEHIVSIQGAFNAGDPVLLKNPGGAVLAIGTVTTDSTAIERSGSGPLFKYERVLA